MKPNRPFPTHFAISILLIASLAMHGCKKFQGDVSTPAFIHIDAVNVTSSGQGENERIEGWYSSDIDAVQIIALFPGESSLSVLGTFQLPCHVPVLFDGKAKYIEIVPVVKQNGIAATRIEYPFLQHIVLNDVDLKSGQVTYLGTADPASGLHCLEAHYYSPDYIKQEFFENFEALHTEIHFTHDKVQWIKDDPDGARSGSSYGLIHTPADQDGIYFEITDSISVPDPGRIVYLEMDYRTDVEFRIGLRSPITSGSADHTLYALSLYPQKEWTKIYVNLSKLWGQMNHYSPFHVVFLTTNTGHIDGQTRIDNVKIITK